MSELEATLDRIYRELLEAGKRAGRSNRPAIRDVWFSAAALVAKEALAHGLKVSETPHGA